MTQYTRVSGVDTLVKKMQKLEMDIPVILAESGEVAMMAIVEAQAKQWCPVDTGHLQTSIHTLSEIRGNEVTIQTGTNLFYGKYIEFGTGIYATNGTGRQTPWGYIYKGHKGKPGLRFTHGNKPQPFLIPAFRDNVDRIFKTLKDQVNVRIKRFVRTKGGK